MTPRFEIARPVEARLKDNEFVEAGSHDFRLGPPASAPAGHWSPYALSPDCRTLFWVRTDEPPHRSDAPFLYLAQYRAATHLAESDARTLPEAVGAPRTLVFSVGRCGSTLLVDMARRAGLTCLSEPDALTPLALDRPPPPNVAGVYAPVLDAALEGWRAGAAREPALVKLRAQHSNPHHLALASAALTDARFVFVFREPRAWARSVAGHFRLPVERLIDLYRAPLEALAAARERGVAAEVVLYETMRDGRAVAAALGLDRVPDAPERSSQGGTRLAGRPPVDGPTARTVEAFLRQWPLPGAREAGLPY